MVSLFAAGTWNFFETPRLVSFNLSDGSPNWSYDSPFGGPGTPEAPGGVDIVAAGPNGSLYATEGDLFNQIPFVAFTLDGSGNRTDNPTSSQAVTYVANAGIGSSIWMGSNDTSVTAVEYPDFGLGLPEMMMQSGGTIPLPGITAYLGTFIGTILSSFAEPSPREQCALTVNIGYGLPVPTVVPPNVRSQLRSLFAPDVHLKFISGLEQLNMSVSAIVPNGELETGVLGAVPLDQKGNPRNQGVVDYGKHLALQKTKKASDAALGQALGRTIGHELGHELFLGHNKLNEGLMAPSLDPFVPNAFTDTDHINIMNRCLFLQRSK